MSAEGERWRGKIFPSPRIAGCTDRSVMLVACPYCAAARGKLCLGRNGPKLGTHFTRRHRVNPQHGCSCIGCEAGRSERA